MAEIARGPFADLSPENGKPIDFSMQAAGWYMRDLLDGQLEEAQTYDGKTAQVRRLRHFLWNINYLGFHLSETIRDDFVHYYAGFRVPLEESFVYQRADVSFAWSVDRSESLVMSEHLECHLTSEAMNYPLRRREHTEFDMFYPYDKHCLKNLLEAAQGIKAEVALIEDIDVFGHSVANFALDVAGPSKLRPTK